MRTETFLIIPAPIIEAQEKAVRHHYFRYKLSEAFLSTVYSCNGNVLAIMAKILVEESTRGILVFSTGNNHPMGSSMVLQRCCAMCNVHNVQCSAIFWAVCVCDIGARVL